MKKIAISLSLIMVALLIIAATKSGAESRDAKPATGRFVQATVVSPDDTTETVDETVYGLPPVPEPEAEPYPPPEPDGYWSPLPPPYPYPEPVTQPPSPYPQPEAEELPEGCVLVLWILVCP